MTPWDTRYSDPKYAARRLPSQAMVDRMQKFFARTPYPEILDAGCGTGRNAWWLATHGANVFAVDASQVATMALRDEAAAAGLSMAVGCGDFLTMGFGDNSYDGVLCAGVFCNFSPAQMSQALGLFARTLRPNGLLIFNCRTTDDKRNHGSIAEHERDLPLSFFTELGVHAAIATSGLNLRELGTIVSHYDDGNDEDWIVQAVK